MSEHENELEGPEGLSRRKMIQRTAAAGAVVWSTPVIMASPAGAQTVESPGGGEDPECENFRVFGFKYEVGSNYTEGGDTWRLVTIDNVVVGRFTGLGNGDDCIANYPGTMPSGQAASDCANRALVNSLIVTESSENEVRIQFPTDCNLATASAVAKEGSENAGDGCDYTVDDAAALEQNVLVFKKADVNESENNLGVSNVQVKVRCCADDYLDDCPNGV